MNTNELIDGLAKELKPVQPLPRPSRRAAAWLVTAAAYLGLSAAGLSLWSAATIDPIPLIVPQFLAMLAGGLAADAAFASVVPGHGRRWLIFPALAVTLWILALAVSAPEPLAVSRALSANHEWLCVTLIVVGALPLLALLAVMLRRGAPLHPVLSASLGALSVGMLANVGACYSTPHPASDVTLVWHGSAVLALVLVCAVGGPYLLRWRAPRH
jgi:hypothetical protein